MAIYAIGDIQGCYEEFRALLKQLRFHAGRDRLWLVGDLVNRGPKSLETLRFVKDLGEAALCVLGNHDLHLLAEHVGARQTKPGSSLRAVLEAHDREELIDWLRRRPLLHHDETLGYTMLHAGLVPQWDLATARTCAAEVEHLLRGGDYQQLMYNMYGDQPDFWSASLTDWPRARVIINVFTRLRYCDAEGRMDMHASGPPGNQPSHLMPWFQVPDRRNKDINIVFGHWAALGYHRAPGIIALDSGCVWGGALTAVRLDANTSAPIHLPCEGVRARA
ncbi:MAG: symmetrical bis(5'-nucleosyl)-tetraphosphatase [Pseudomonadota bacterium]|nr:symmetrical bis(5'-nucleosyl)-tetraphosphatase [Pseudomonadota bacterium]